MRGRQDPRHLFRALGRVTKPFSLTSTKPICRFFMALAWISDLRAQAFVAFRRKLVANPCAIAQDLRFSASPRKEFFKVQFSDAIRDLTDGALRSRNFLQLSKVHANTVLPENSGARVQPWQVGAPQKIAALCVSWQRDRHRGSFHDPIGTFSLHPSPRFSLRLATILRAHRTEASSRRNSRRRA